MVGLALLQLDLHPGESLGIIGQVRFHRGYKPVHLVQSGHRVLGLVQQCRGARFVAHARQPLGQFDVFAGGGCQIACFFQRGLHEGGIPRLFGGFDQRFCRGEVGRAFERALIQRLCLLRIAQRLGHLARQRQQVGNAGELFRRLVENRFRVLLVEQMLGRGGRQLAVFHRARDFRLGLFQHLLGERVVGDHAHHVLRQVDQRIEVVGFLQRLFVGAHRCRLVAQYLELGFRQHDLLLARHAVVFRGLQQFLGASLLAQRLVGDGAGRQVLSELAVIRHAVHQLLGVGGVRGFLQGFQRQRGVLGAAAALGFFGGEGVAGGHGGSPGKHHSIS